MKTFRYAVIVVLAAATILLVLIYGALFLAYLALMGKFWDWEDRTLSPLLVWELILLAICLGALIAHVGKRKRWYPKRLWHWSAFALLLALQLIVLTIDAPPVANDYTRADIAPPSPEAEKSYEILMTYRKGKEPDFQIKAPHVLSLEAITNALPYAAEIEKAWEDIANGRNYIEKLDSFEQIVDLTPKIPIDLETPIINFIPLRTIAYVYRTYAVLKAEEGQAEEGVRTLVQLHSVCRKALPHCAILIPKMMWIAIAQGNIETAHRIAMNPNCTPETLAILKAGFYPLTAEDVSMRRPLIAEYLWMKSVCESYLTRTNLLGCFVLDSSGQPPYGFLGKTVSGIAFTFFFNRNRTILKAKERFGLLVAGASKCPPDISSATAALQMTRPDLRNPVGQMLVEIVVPSFSITMERSSKTKVLSDLLAITLARRSGQELNLPDFYTGKAYIVDQQTGAVMSVGPDGLPGTMDDIKLGDWP